MLANPELRVLAKTKSKGDAPCITAESGAEQRLRRVGLIGLLRGRPSGRVELLRLGDAWHVSTPPQTRAPHHAEALA